MRRGEEGKSEKRGSRREEMKKRRISCRKYYSPKGT